MKKYMIFAAVFVSLVILGVAIYLAITFLAMETDGKAEATEQTTQAQITDIAAYAKQNYPEFTAQYNAKEKVLTLEKTTDFSLSSAQSIYTDTSTYEMQARIFALDICAACEAPDLTVVLCYLSKDGEPMLRVGSDGSIVKSWE